jgi:hypothetical protein
LTTRFDSEPHAPQARSQHHKSSFISSFEDNYMPFIKSITPAGKKQALMPGPKSAAYKKIVAARKRAVAGKLAPSTSAKKRPKTSHFSTLKSRQMTVECIKREIWASVQQINQAIINLALAGNYNAARALFDFAGVYNLPAPEEAAPAIAFCAASAESASAQPIAPNPVDAFFRSIGIEPVGDEPEPDIAACARS